MDKPAEHVFRLLALLCMGCMSIAAVVIAVDPLRRYGELSKGTLVYYVISLAGGVVLALCLFMALRFPPKLHKVAVGGLSAILALGINQIVGLRFGTILCFTPR
jgi:uncharacterized membrane protein